MREFRRSWNKLVCSGSVTAKSPFTQIPRVQGSIHFSAAGGEPSG
jgi:hypothetical protein